MSRHPSRERNMTIPQGDDLAVIREEKEQEHTSPHSSKPDIAKLAKSNKLRAKWKSVALHARLCHAMTMHFIEEVLARKEEDLRAEFDAELKKQLSMMRERFDFVLQHEQMRSCCMLREAHRERQEKVQALQTQLECKNMTGLMYVLCAERRKAKLEKMRIIEEYTKYIHTLQDILTEGQLLILHLSRGYKTAARVDNEWRAKMKSIIKEFQEYVYHFAGGTPESNQYVFDVPALLKTEASLVDDPEEDPCTCEESEGSVEEGGEGDEFPREKTWWELLDSPCRPFVMFGDMEEFLPPQRRQVVASAKATAKSAPPKWKEYVFNEMFVKSDCPNADFIKDEYPKHLPVDKWECQNTQNDSDSIMSPRWGSRRVTTNSNEMRNMGSILKLMTSSNLLPPKTNLLGARDSMEIASSTRLREKRNGCNGSAKNVSICIARTRSVSEENQPMEFTPKKDLGLPETLRRARASHDSDGEDIIRDGVGSNHQDSLQVINPQAHKPSDGDQKINYEKICPMDKCQRMQVDSFMRTLPGYMRASPYTLFEETFEGYETCSPEQLEILKQRLANKAKVDIEEEVVSLPDIEPMVDGIGVQTSEEWFTGLPPCTCKDPNPSIASSTTRIFKVADLIPMKEALDEITKECFHNQHILFDRFKVVGQENTRISYDNVDNVRKDKEEFKNLRVLEIKNILRRHPSMLDLFQPNARC